MEEQTAQSESTYNWQVVDLNKYARQYFHQFHKDFKFRLACTYQLGKSLHVHGKLIYNNGSTVPISISHHSIVNLFLNKQRQPIRKTVIYSIDMNSQTLTFSAKVSAVKTVQIADKWLELIQQEINLQKKLIAALLIIIGIPIDSEHVIMRKVLILKKKLKNELAKLFNNSQEQIAYMKQSFLKSTMEDESKDRAVIEFGANKSTQIRQLKTAELDTNEQRIKHKKMDGGYFVIDEFMYQVRGDNGNERKVLAKKMLKEKRKADPSRRSINDKKLKKQLQIVRNIENKNYLLKYYYEQSESIEYILMERFDQSLQEYIYYMGDSIELPNKLCIAKQIVESVISLHHSEVIHRDVKPSNFLLNDYNDRIDKYQLKIIDFAESYCERLQDKDGDYACSHPYSPIECSDRKGVTQNQADIGINRKEIDYWSVGMTIFELFFRKLPVSFSRAFLTDITASWKTELLLAVDQREKCGLRVVQDIITILCVKTLKFDQDKRLKLYLMHIILEMLETYVSNLMKLLEDTN